MKKYKVLVLYALLTTALAGGKNYRADYVYECRTDSFYKLHLHKDPNDQREQVCENEGATLMPRMSKQNLSQIHASIGQENSCIGDNWEWGEDQPVLDLESEAQDILELNCKVTTWDGRITTSAVYRDQPFVCKVEAKDVPYSSRCRTRVKGYNYHPSVGSCYRIPQIAKTWREAGAQCQAEGAHLAVINSQYESTLLKDLTDNIYVTGSMYQPSFHIGFRAIKTTEPRLWRTVFNETLEEAGFGTWHPGEPNNLQDNEHCGAMLQTEGKLNDVPCDCILGFICEKEVAGKNAP